MPLEAELAVDVERMLREGKWKFQKEVVVGNANADFLITTERGDQIVLDVKAWEDSPENTARAIHQSQRYKELSKAAAALIVTAAGEALTLSSGGVFPAAHLMAALSNLADSLSKGKKSPKPQPVHVAPKKKVFASMPFAANYDDTFLVGIAPAAIVNNAVAERVDHNGTPGNVIAQIQAMIKGARVVVADLSDSRPNVLHEVGYAEALGKPVVQICSTPTSQLPFNVRNNQTITYVIGQASKLQKKLEVELAKVI